MRLIEIAAIGRNRELGKDNRLIWHLPSDLKFFKAQTQGKTIVMGRKTFESLPGKLPGRHHVILSRNFTSDDPDLEIFRDLDSFLEAYRDLDQDVFIVGGASLYEQMLPYAQELILTQIDADFEADVFFPAFDPADFDESALPDVSENGLRYRHTFFKRRQGNCN